MSLGAIVAIAAFLTVALLRIDYAFDLDWMEGGGVDLVAAIVGGQKLYAAPTVDHCAYLYAPLYFYLCAAVAPLFGATYACLRGVSLLASVGCLSLLFRHAWLETGRAVVGLWAAGLYAASFVVCGSWYDLARVDALYLFLLLSVLHLARFHRTTPGYALAGLLLAAAFFTKQTALGMVPPLTLCGLFVSRRAAAALASTALSCSGVTYALLDWYFDGYYRYYCFTVPAGHRIVKKMLELFWTVHVLPHLAIALLLTVVYLLMLWRRRDLERLAFYGMAGGSLVAMSWLSLLKVGGYKNVLMPAVAMLSLGAALALGEAARHRAGPLLRIPLLALCLAQLIHLRYDPRTQVPTAADRQAAARLVARLAAVDGDVLVPFHGAINALAGKPRHAHVVGIHDVMAGDRGPIGKSLRRSVQDALATHRFAVVVLDSRWFPGEMESYYERSEAVAHGDGVLWSLTGRRTRPEWLHRPRVTEVKP